MGLVAGAAAVAGAATGEPSLAAVMACRSIAEGAARLACFDRELAAVDAGSARPAAAAAPVASVPRAAAAAPVLDPRQQFGLSEGAVTAREVAAGARAPEVSKIEAHVVSMATAADLRLVFTLDNQQVWRQIKTEGELLAKVGDAVTIHRGALGSYWLQLPSGRGCKVSRLR